MVAWPAVAGALTATVALLNVVKRKRAKDLYKVPLASGCLPIVGRISMLPVRHPRAPNCSCTVCTTR